MGTQWQEPGNFPRLEPGLLHVWLAFYDPTAFNEANVLSQEELNRHNRFHFAEDRRMFLYSHSLLRRLLASYLNQLPGEIQFSYTEHNKPYLETSDQQTGIEFNLSHSGEAVLIGITKGLPVGVDVEKMEPLPDMDQIAARFFSDREQSDLSTLSGSAKMAAFYHCWTRKESVIKASGEGLSMPLDSFRVSLLPGEPARVIESVDDRQWMLLDINPGNGFAAAAAVPTKSLAVSYYSANF